MEHHELYTGKLNRGRRTYFFDIKQTEQKDFYIKITESKPSHNAFEHHHIMVFEEDIEDFMVSFIQCMANYHKLKDVKGSDNRSTNLSGSRNEHPNAYMPWTEEDDEKLEFLFCEKKTVNELAFIFQRNEGAISSRIKRLGLKEKYGK